MRKLRIYQCKYCDKPFESRDPRTKFCGRSCAAKFNNTIRHISNEHRRNASKAMHKYWKDHPREKEKKDRLSQQGKNKRPKSILDLSKRTISKICRRMNMSCSRCGWNEEICDIHHIVPKRKGGSDDHSNLTYLCPNCHRLADRGKLDANDLINLEEYVGESWLSKYYG